MSSKLPFNLEDLLRQKTVEGERIEYKAGWNPDAIIRTLRAFANDFENLGGGYIVIGQDCDSEGRPVFPPVGVDDGQLDKIQRELLTYCNLIQPTYFPALSVEKFQGKNLLVLRAPGGLNRPYKAPRAVTANSKSYHYFIRRYSSTIEAKGDDERELLSLTATIPFDDRMCRKAGLEDLRLSLIMSFLKDAGSDLYSEAANMPLIELARNMNIVDGPDEDLKPKNVGILFFNEAPEKFFPGAYVDVVVFPQGVAGDEIIERTFKGPIHQQLRDVLQYLKGMAIFEKVVKLPDQAESVRVFNYPYRALEEAVVNAVYHRSYEDREPVEIRINPDSIQIVSYPGTDPSIKLDEVRTGKIVARRYRNRRIGEFLKELELTEGRSTGIPAINRAMASNGSPAARFDTNSERSYFVVELPIHTAVMVEVTTEVTHEIGGLLLALKGEMTRGEMLKAIKLKNAEHFRKSYLQPALQAGLIEMTIPDKPQSSKQKYRLTAKGELQKLNILNR